MTHTDADRHEWTRIVERMRVLAEQYHAALEDAGGWMQHRITHPDAADFALAEAEKAAARALDLWAEREALAVQADATPYGAVMRARVDARLVARVARP